MAPMNSRLLVQLWDIKLVTDSVHYCSLNGGSIKISSN